MVTASEFPDETHHDDSVLQGTNPAGYEPLGQSDTDVVGKEDTLAAGTGQSRDALIKLMLSQQLNHPLPGEKVPILPRTHPILPPRVGIPLGQIYSLRPSPPKPVAVPNPEKVVEKKPTPEELERRAATVVDPIIEKVENPAIRGTLSRMSKTELHSAITQIQAARARAIQRGEELSDREAYLRFHKASTAQNPDPRVVQMFKIIDLLMGGNFRGKLPF